MKLKSIIVVCTLIVMTGCSPLENNARDAAAALSGSIVAAQAKYQDTCTANKTQQICETINKGVSAENALITAIETYCGMAISPTPPDRDTPCHPVKTAETALSAAISNANTLTSQIKGAI